MYNALVIPVVLYGAETWTLTNKIKEKLDSFDRRRLRTIIKQFNIEDEELRVITSQPELSKLVAARVVRWFGHAIRMADSGLAKKIKLCTPSRSGRHGRMRPTLEGEAIEEARSLGAR